MCGFFPKTIVEWETEGSANLEVSLFCHWFACWNIDMLLVIGWSSRLSWIIPPSTQITHLVSYCDTPCNIPHPAGFKVVSKLVCPLVGNLLKAWHLRIQAQETWCGVFCITWTQYYPNLSNACNNMLALLEKNTPLFHQLDYFCFLDVKKKV